MLPFTFMFWEKTINSDLYFDMLNIVLWVHSTISFRPCWSRCCVVDRTIPPQRILMPSTNNYTFIEQGIIVVIPLIPTRNNNELSTEP